MSMVSPSKGFFYTVTSFNDASQDSVFSFSPVFPLHFPYEGKCQNNGRPEMTDRRWRPDMTESPSTGSGRSLPSFVLTAFLYIQRSCVRIML